MQKNEFDPALRRFIMAMEKVSPIEAFNCINECSSELCDLLRISRIDVKITEPPIGNYTHTVAERRQVFRSDGVADTSRTIHIEKNTIAGSRVDYFITPYIDADEWTDQELNEIADFISTMFVFNGRSRAIAICSELTFNDLDLEVNNVNFFFKRLGELIAEEKHTDFTAFRFNLKKFSLINKKIGLDNGTEVMRRYIHGLRDIIKPEGFISRLGGDNFVGICIHEKVEQVRTYLIGRSVPTDAPGIDTVFVSAHTGYYKIAKDNRIVPDIMDKLSTTIAMLKRKQDVPFIVYDEEVNKKAERRRWVEGSFKNAIENEEFEVYYQPKINLKNYTLSGAEALCRWRNKGKLVPPGDFIPILEQSSNICILDFYMLEHVCRDMKKWLDQGMPVVKVSVNISRVHLGNENLAANIIDIIKKYNVPNELIEIELTETTTDVDFAELKKIVATLHSVGISTSIDDFGIGYSSLNLIRELPWNVLKIDRSFLPLANEKNSSQKKIMLKYVIAMAQSLGLECIVEGVETVEHIALLKENNCYRAQGFFFDKPLPVDEFEERLITKQIMV